MRDFFYITLAAFVLKMVVLSVRNAYRTDWGRWLLGFCAEKFFTERPLVVVLRNAESPGIIAPINGLPRSQALLTNEFCAICYGREYMMYEGEGKSVSIEPTGRNGRFLEILWVEGEIRGWRVRTLKHGVTTLSRMSPRELAQANKVLGAVYKALGKNQQ